MWLHFFPTVWFCILQQIIRLSRWRNFLLLLRCYQLQRYGLHGTLAILQPSKLSSHRLKQLLEIVSILMHTLPGLLYRKYTVHFQRLLNLKFPSWVPEQGVSETLEDNPEAWHTCNIFCLWSSGQSSWPQIQRSLVRFPALPDFLGSSGSGTGCTQTSWVQLRSYFEELVAAPV
jgi:hypothetical protein